MEEPGILREGCTEEEEAAAKSEGLSRHYLDGSALKQCSEGFADQNCGTEESDQGVSGKVDSTLVDQQNELPVEDPAGGSAIAEETEVEGKPMENSLNDALGEVPEAVPVETEGTAMENTLNDAIGEEPEAVPLETRGKTMEDTLNDSGSLPLKSQGDLQTEEHDDGGKLGASEATEGNDTMPAETVSCATGANSAVPVPEAGKPEDGSEGAPPEEESAEATAPATHDNCPKGDDDDKNKEGLSDEDQKLKEMLQKLLVSGNDQMGIIAELSDKVKSLERKLAVHKRRRPKVRVQHRAVRDTTANNVH
ncbi:uncharacterized protein [Triticum aestivum]|uniref:uncharacterized protein n=1 Tax=Triticum aestivum TaxID=4565 RepID=UPI001D001F59|nr:uncharacterized protein LOC123101845 [Triticum aestivum]